MMDQMLHGEHYEAYEDKILSRHNVTDPDPSDLPHSARFGLKIL